MRLAGFEELAVLVSVLIVEFAICYAAITVGAKIQKLRGILKTKPKPALAKAKKAGE